MLRRSNPWPSIVDLFSALLLLSFGGMMLLSGLVPHPGGKRGTASELQVKAHSLMEGAYYKLTSAGMQARINTCGEDTCIQAKVQFRTNEDVIYLENQIKGLQEACWAIKSALDQMRPEERQAVQLVIEGHTDHQPFARAKTDRGRFLGNWWLSAGRAAAVLYEFKGCGLNPPKYAITSVGKADTEHPSPPCVEDTPECGEEHRRTTLRLHVDTIALEKQIPKAGQGK